MILRKYSTLALGAFLVLATLSSIHAVEKPSLTAQSQERNGDWIKIDVSLISKADYKVVLKPKEVVVKLSDGTDVKDWRWLHFFPEASVNLKKGDEIQQIAEDLGGKLIALSYIVVKEGSEATIEVPLKSGVAQKAQLYFRAPGKTHAKTLSFGLLSAQVPQKK